MMAAELFVTDGSAGGIHLLKDINPGIAASINMFTGFVVEGTQAFFAADNGQLLASWTTDGTPDGTVMYSFGATSLSKRIERPYL
jgi:ELWxxDGT repeat protein